MFQLVKIIDSSAPHQGDIRCCEKNGGEAVYSHLLIIKKYIIILIQYFLEDIIMAYQVFSKDRLIPGTNGEMNEEDIRILGRKLEANDNFTHIGTLPVTERVINTLIMIKKGTREELVERNRKLYEARGWEAYI